MSLILITVSSSSLPVSVQVLIIRPVTCWWPSSSSRLISLREFTSIVWRMTSEPEIRSAGNNNKYCPSNSDLKNFMLLITEMLKKTENHQSKSPTLFLNTVKKDFQLKVLQQFILKMPNKIKCISKVLPTIDDVIVY